MCKKVMHLIMPLWPVTKAADTGRLHYLHIGEHWQLFFLLITPLVALSSTEPRVHRQLYPEYSHNKTVCPQSLVTKKDVYRNYISTSACRARENRWRMMQSVTCKRTLPKRSRHAESNSRSLPCPCVLPCP